MEVSVPTSIRVNSGSSQAGPFLNRPKSAVSEPAWSAVQPQCRQDRITLSPEGREASSQNPVPHQESASSNATQKTSRVTLSPEEQQKLLELKTRDKEVRAHEQAHLAAAGQYASGGPSFTYQRGPDGKRYAVAGEVPVDIGKEPTPEATIQKMETIRRAALSPANPSPTDRQIAAQASITAARARQELNIQDRDNSHAAAEDQNQGEITFSRAIPPTSGSTDPTETAPESTVRAMIDTYTAILALG